MSAGSDYTCALLSYEMVRCRGKNSQGQLGNGKTTSSSTPVQVSGITTAAQVSAGLAEHTCASLSDGTVKCWGDGGLGQLGNGQSDEIRTIPVSVIRLP